MGPSVIDGVVAIEAKAAKLVDEAKAHGKERKTQVEADLERLAKELNAQAEHEVAGHTKGVEVKKADALAELDRQLQAALEAVEAVKSSQVASAAAEVAGLVEQRG